MPFGRLARENGQLDHRYIGIGIDQRQRHPCAMVKPAVKVESGIDAGGVENGGDLSSQHRIAGRRVTLGV